MGKNIFATQGEIKKKSFYPFFVWIYIRQLLKIPRFSKIEEIFFKLLCGLRFSPKSFCFFFNRIARYAQSKESRNLSSEIPQTTYKAIFRSCHKLN